MNNNPLGKTVATPDAYAPEVLCAIPRSEGRGRLNSDGGEGLPDAIYGFDHWHAWELSWLESSGLPRVAVGELFFPMTSPNIVESKSLKLYLNSLNDKAFENAEVVRLAIRGDLSAAVGGQVKVLVQELSTVTETDGNLLPIPLSECQSKNIDDVGLGEGNVFNKRLFAAGPDSRLIKVVPGAKMAKCAVRSDLFRSNCPVTGQPDWASVEIRYRGRRLDEAALLHYLFSYRHHRAFHEECAERIFRDVYQACKPDSLWLGLNFLRRGGLDINVYRSTEPMEAYGLRRRMLRQ